MFSSNEAQQKVILRLFWHAWQTIESNDSQTTGSSKGYYSQNDKYTLF